VAPDGATVRTADFGCLGAQP